METLTERLNHLKSRGYNSNYCIRDGLLYSDEIKYLPLENTKIDNTYRIEDDSDPTCQSVVYALSCSSPQSKGVLINSFGLYSESDKDEFIEKLSSKSE